MKKNEKILAIILMLIIITGIACTCLFGFNKSIEYTSGTRVEVYIAKGYEKQDIINIAKESFNTQDVYFNDVEKLNQIAGIKLNEYTAEQLDTFKTKISEKYNINKEKLDIYEVQVPETKIINIIEPYVNPVILVVILTLIYIGIRCIKNKKVFKIILKEILTLVIVIGVYFSIIVIFRLPFSSYTMPIGLGIYLITTLVIANNITKVKE